MSSLILAIYVTSLSILMIYGLHRYWILFLYWKHHKKNMDPGLRRDDDLRLHPHAEFIPHVTVQLPLYNEKYVAPRLIQAVSEFTYPKDKLHIQVLDDSTDETVDVVRRIVEEKRQDGFHIDHVRRTKRVGFKAGALAYGLKQTKGEFIAIFDADFIPPKDFLLKTLPQFENDKVGMVQTRWGHINANYSLLTRLQALFLDGHFLLEHTARHKSGAFFNFNGTAGVWRKKAIESAGGWNSRTLTEDLDLSYRAQLKGWQFIYLPDYVCPAELPVDIHAFRSQQKRWTKGAIQVARYLLKDLWKAKLPFHTKMEATAHLTANIGYFLTGIVSLLLLPSLLIRHQLDFPGLPFIEIGAFLLTTVSISFFYMVSQRELYPNWKWKMRDIPALLSFGIGMCISNAKAVWEGLTGNTSDFIRTPKYNIKTKVDSWVQKSYSRDLCTPWFMQSLFALYSIVTFFIAAYYGNWLALPFITLFVFGYSYVTSLSISHCTSS